MKVEPIARIDGHIGVPGDKSVSHRALLIGALTEGETRVERWGRSGDTESTLGLVRALGVRVDEEDVDGEHTISSVDADAVRRMPGSV